MYQPSVKMRAAVFKERYMDTFQSKYITKCIIWAAGGQQVFSMLMVLMMIPIALDMSEQRDPAPLIPISLIAVVARCAWVAVAEFICLDKAFKESRSFPRDPMKWFGGFVGIQVGMQLKEGMSRIYSFSRMYDSSSMRLSTLPASNERMSVEKYLTEYLETFNRGVLIQTVVGVVLTAVTFFILYGRYKTLAKQYGVQ